MKHIGLNGALLNLIESLPPCSTFSIGSRKFCGSYFISSSQCSYRSTWESGDWYRMQWQTNALNSQTRVCSLLCGKHSAGPGKRKMKKSHQRAPAFWVMGRKWWNRRVEAMTEDLAAFPLQVVTFNLPCYSEHHNSWVSLLYHCCQTREGNRNPQTLLSVMSLQPKFWVHEKTKPTCLL